MTAMLGLALKAPALTFVGTVACESNVIMRTVFALQCAGNTTCWRFGVCKPLEPKPTVKGKKGSLKFKSDGVALVDDSSSYLYGSAG
jgi:hypothetical protein